MKNLVLILLLATLSLMLGGCGAASLDANATAVSTTNNISTKAFDSLIEQMKAAMQLGKSPDLNALIQQIQDGASSSAVEINDVPEEAILLLLTIQKLGCALGTIIFALPITFALLALSCYCSIFCGGGSTPCPGCGPTTCGSPEVILIAGFFLWCQGLQDFCKALFTLLDFFLKLTKG